MIYQRQQVMPMSKHLRESGFTLVELLIVIAILGILAGIAYPAFSDYLNKSRRSDGTSQLLKIAAKQEQFFLDNKRYTKDFKELGFPSSASVTSEKGYYTITISNFTNYTYTLTAQPSAGSPQSKDKCKSFTIDQDSTKGGTSDGTITRCW